MALGAQYSLLILNTDRRIKGIVGVGKDKMMKRKERVSERIKEKYKKNSY